MSKSEKEIEEAIKRSFKTEWSRESAITGVQLYRRGKLLKKEGR